MPHIPEDERGTPLQGYWQSLSDIFLILFVIALTIGVFIRFKNEDDKKEAGLATLMVKELNEIKELVDATETDTVETQIANIEKLLSEILTSVEVKTVSKEVMDIMNKHSASPDSEGIVEQKLNELESRLLKAAPPDSASEERRKAHKINVEKALYAIGKLLNEKKICENPVSGKWLGNDIVATAEQVVKFLNDQERNGRKLSDYTKQLERPSWVQADIALNDEQETGGTKKSTSNTIKQWRKGVNYLCSSVPFKNNKAGKKVARDGDELTGLCMYSNSIGNHTPYSLIEHVREVKNDIASLLGLELGISELKKTSASRNTLEPDSKEGNSSLQKHLDELQRQLDTQKPSYNKLKEELEKAQRILAASKSLNVKIAELNRIVAEKDGELVKIRNETDLVVTKVFQDNDQGIKFGSDKDVPDDPDITNYKAFDEFMIKDIKTRLTANPCTKFDIEVIGHTDPDGGEEYNVVLGFRRAKFIAQAIKKALALKKYNIPIEQQSNIVFHPRSAAFASFLGNLDQPDAESKARSRRVEVFFRPILALPKSP